MTSKEALKIIGELYLFEESVQIPYDPPLKEQYKKEYEILLDLVECDTPMKVINGTTINGVCLDYECPSCKQQIDTDRYSKDQYYLIKCCISCLQRLDWNQL